MNVQTIQRATLSLLVLSLPACSDSSGNAPDSMGMGATTTPPTSTAGSGGSPTTVPTGTAGSAPVGAAGAMMTGTGAGNTVPLTVDPTGWVDKGGNTLGIQGPWYSYDDCTNSPMACTMNHTPGMGAFTNTDGKMCTKGTTIAVKAEADFSKEWGAGIALDLNNSGGMNAMKMPFDATAAHVIGFSLNITGTAPGLRINITSVAAGDNSHFANGVIGANTVMLSKVAQGSWVTTKMPLDSTMLLAIQFQIPTVMNKAVDFDFCVDSLAAITQ